MLLAYLAWKERTKDQKLWIEAGAPLLCFLWTAVVVQRATRINDNDDIPLLRDMVPRPNIPFRAARRTRFA